MIGQNGYAFEDDEEGLPEWLYGLPGEAVVVVDPVTLDWAGGDTFEGEDIGLTVGDPITTWSGAKGRRVLEQLGATNLKPLFRVTPDRADFDGIEDDLVADSGQVNGSALSISIVTNDVVIGATQRLLYINNAQRIIISSAGALSVEVRTVNDGYVLVNTSVLSNWTDLKHVAVTYDGATIRVYENGEELATGAATGDLAPRAGFNHHLGSTAGSTQFYQGDVLHYAYATEAYGQATFEGIARFYGVIE